MNTVENNVTIKESLIEKIREKYQDYAFWKELEGGYPYSDTPYMHKSSLLNSLKYLPEENLAKLLDADLDRNTTAAVAYQEWGLKGAFKFRPYVVTDGKGNPSLCIRWNRFLHVFRKQGFQVSYTEDGHYDAGSTLYRMDFLMSPQYPNEVATCGLIAYMCWWASVISLGFQYDNFYELYMEDPGVIEDFLHRAMRSLNIEMEWSLSDIGRNISFSRGKVREGRKVYQFVDKKSADKAYARFAIGKNTIQLEIDDYDLVTLTYPDFNLGAGYDMEDEDDRDALDAEVYIFERSHYREILLLGLCALQKINVNFQGWHFIGRKAAAIRSNSDVEFTPVYSLNEVYGAEPDEF